MTLKVLQWNCMYSEDVESVVELIQGLSPDIVFLQELTKDYRPEYPDAGGYIAKRLGYHRHYSYGVMQLPDDDIAQVGMGIFCKYPLSFKQKVVLQEGIVDSSGSVLTDERFFLQASIEIEGRVIGVGTTHLPFHPRFQTTPRKRQMFDTIMQSAGQYEDYIFGADLNATPYAKTTRSFRSAGFKNAGPALRYPSWTTKPFSIGPWHYSSLQWRLDYLLVKGDLKGRVGRLIETELSDHLPLLVEIS